MKKIIHLSDLHVGYDELAVELSELVARIVDNVAPGDEHVVVVTGDIAENATHEGSHEVAVAQFTRLREVGFTVLPVPGNHDYGTGTLGDARYVDKFKQSFYGTIATTYPKLDIVDGVAFIGLDSTAEELHWYDRLFAEGELGSEQLGRLTEMLKSAVVLESERRVVYLHHHPFHPKPFHELKDSAELCAAVSEHNIDALLFGHNHDGESWNGTWGIGRVYDAGSSTGKNGKTRRYRVMDLTKVPDEDYEVEL